MMRSIGIPAHDVPDVLQVVLTETWKHAGRFDPAKGSAETWLFQIARRRTIDYLRHRGHERPADWERTPSGGEVNGGGVMVRDALAGLSDRERRVLVLSYYYGYTQREIAEAWAVPLGTVKSWAHRALERLRERMSSAPEAGG
jgi:RNA polymerase sigma-70 factor (ECF subfamily)